MQIEQLKDLVVEQLEDMKAQNINVLSVAEKTSIADFLVIASGTSSRHVKSLADTVVQKAKESGKQPLGVEGEDTAEWVLVDLGDVIVHIMLPTSRDFYQLEKLWGEDWPKPEESAEL